MLMVLFLVMLWLGSGSLRRRMLRRRRGVLRVSIWGVHWRHAIWGCTIRWIVAHGREGHHLPLWRRWHGVAMSSPTMTLAVVGILRKVAIGVSSWRGRLREWVLFIGRKGILSVVWLVAERDQLASRRLCTAWVAVVRHHARCIAVRRGLWNVTPALAGVARRAGSSSRRRGVWVVVLVF